MSQFTVLPRPGPWAAQASLNRLHLLYRFDLRQRIWVLQALEIRSGNNPPFPTGLAALATAIAKNISDFSDPAPGGESPVKTACRRMEIRQLFKRPLRKTKNQQRKK